MPTARAKAETSEQLMIPLTGAEELLFLLDSPGEPQNQRVEIELPGRLERARLRRATRAVMERQELLRARLRPWRASDRRLVWEVGAEPPDAPVAHVVAGDATDLQDVRDQTVSQPFDLVCGPPFRLTAVERDDRTHLLLVAHHTAVDLQGMLIVLREVAAAYSGRPAPLPERSAPPTPAVLGGLGDRCAGARALGRVASGAVRRTARVSPDGATPNATGVHVGGLRLSPAQTAALDPARLAARARMTDLLLAAGVLAIDRWNVHHGRHGGRIALLHAIGLPIATGRPPISNSWMGTVIAANPSARVDGRTLLSSIVAQRRRETRMAQAGALRAALEAGLPVPIWAKRALPAVHPLTAHRLVESGALTHLGRIEPFDFGRGLVSDAVWADGPVRLPKGLFVGCALHGDALHVALRSSRAQLSRQALRHFGECYLAALDELG